MLKVRLSFDPYDNVRFSIKYLFLWLLFDIPQDLVGDLVLHPLLDVILDLKRVNR